MIDFDALAKVAAIYALGVLTPGPNFLAVAYRALRHGRIQAVAVAAGVVTVNALWAASALFGMVLVFQAFPMALPMVKLLGAAYLVVIGVQFVAGAARTTVAVPPASGLSGLAASFRLGLATNLTNAKSMAYYASVLSATAPGPGQNATALAGLGVVLVIASIWYGLVACVLSTPRAAAAFERHKPWIERSFGLAMIIFGLLLANSA